METKEVKFTPPEGYEVDMENSDFANGIVRFMEKKRFIDDETHKIGGYYIDNASSILKANETYNVPINYNLFATKKLAKSALAMARISQIMAHDERFGGPIDEEWKDNQIDKYVIGRFNNDIICEIYYSEYEFLAFHTPEQRDLFLEENKQLVRDYLMLD